MCCSDMLCKESFHLCDGPTGLHSTGIPVSECHFDAPSVTLQYLKKDEDKDIPLPSLLKTCAKQKNFGKGCRLHFGIVKRGLLEQDIYVGNSLLHMYVKCGALLKVQEIFEMLPLRDTVSWNALIAGYVEHGHADEALNCFERMHDDGLSASAVTFVFVLKACGTIRSARKGKEIHAEVARQGLLQNNIMLGTAVVDMYVKCGALASAQEVFDELPMRNAISWNALVAGYVEHGHYAEALNCFGKMQDTGFVPNNVTFLCILKACGNLRAVERGKKIHAEIARQHLLKYDIVLGTALVDMYTKFGAVAEAQLVFDELPVRNVVSWSVLLAGYAHCGHSDNALDCFRQMQEEGVSPNAFTFAVMFQSCGTARASEKGEMLHADVSRLGLLGKDLMIDTTLVDMYAKCGALAKAQKVFDAHSLRDVVLWSALIAGYVQHGYAEEALDCFEKMQDEGLYPTAITFVCILKACGSVGAVEKGEEIHLEVSQKGLLEIDTVLHTALIDMYAKCGLLVKAQEVFDECFERDVMCWNALLAGYAQFGMCRMVFDLFYRMIEECVVPDMLNFAVLLSVCCHAGLLDEGQMYFQVMGLNYRIFPSLEHHISMVDLFIRAGYFKKAISVIEKMPSTNYLPLWSDLLGACQKWVNVNLGRWAFENAIQVDQEFTLAYVCMSNIYAAAGMRSKANEIQAMKMKNRAWMDSGYS